MADILCGYTADRDETLVAYLYGDIEPAQRAAFDAHIATCERCRHELAELQQVRGTSSSSGRRRRCPIRWRCLRRPLWLGPRAARRLPAALREHPGVGPGGGGGAGARRVGRASAAPSPTSTCATSAAPDASDRLVAFRVARRGSRAPQRYADGNCDRRLMRPRRGRRDLDGARAAPADRFSGRRRRSRRSRLARTEAGAPSADAQLLRKVRALLEDSERRQRNELALADCRSRAGIRHQARHRPREHSQHEDHSERHRPRNRTAAAVAQPADAGVGAESVGTGKRSRE